MGRDISLIMAPGKSLVDIVKAGQQPDPVKAVLEVVKAPEDELYDRFPEYLEDILRDNDFNKDTSDFNTRTGFVASWILSSVKPAWYFRNCSISLFLEQEDASQEKWSRYTSDWSSVSRDLLPGVTIENHFADANYSLGCLISPENCKNFLDDYKADPNFKVAVDKYFGVFVSGLMDALYSAIEANSELIESMDIFVVYMMNVKTGRWQFNDQYSYTTNTYEETGIALQALSIEAQVCGGYIHKYSQENNQEKVDTYTQERKTVIGLAVRNGNVYVDKVKAKTGLDLPALTPEMWSV